MTPTQAVNTSINLFPTLYATSNAVTAKLRVFDHIFNVIGNGICDTEEFIEYSTLHENSPVHTPLAKYLSGEQLYTGYTESEKFTYGNGPDEFIESPTSGSRINGAYTEAEKVNHPNVVYWLKSHLNLDRPYSPYPNFKKEYSIVWQMDIGILSTEWLDEMIWFYTKCEEFFNGENVNTYYNAVPDDPAGLAARIKDYEEGFAHKTKDCVTNEQRFATITAGWNASGGEIVEYTGNTEDFIRKKWAVNLAKIKGFITETIEMLEKQKLQA